MRNEYRMLARVALLLLFAFGSLSAVADEPALDDTPALSDDAGAAADGDAVVDDTMAGDDATTIDIGADDPGPIDDGTVVDVGGEEPPIDDGSVIDIGGDDPLPVDIGGDDGVAIDDPGAVDIGDDDAQAVEEPPVNLEDCGEACMFYSMGGGEPVEKGEEAAPEVVQMGSPEAAADIDAELSTALGGADATGDDAVAAATPIEVAADVAAGAYATGSTSGAGAARTIRGGHLQ